MQTLRETDHRKVEFDEARKVFKTSWFDDAGDISTDEIKTEISLAAELIIKHRPLFYMIDDRKRLFTYNVEIQKWVAVTIAQACVKVGTEKCAFLMPSDFFAMLSTEQAAEEASPFPIAIKYFDNETDAFDWFGV